MEEYWDFETDRALQVTLTVSCADKPARNVVVVTDFRTLRLTLYKLVMADVAPSDIIIFLLLAGTKALHCQICMKNRYDLRFPHDERIKEFSERIFSDLYHIPLVKVIKTRSEDGRFCAHFVLLGVVGVLYLATKRLEDGLKIRIDNERRFCTILELVELDLRLF